MRRDEEGTRKREKEKKETSLPLPLLPQLPISPTSKKKEGRVRVATRIWEDNADREKTGRSTLKVRARAWLQPTFPNVSTFEEEARGFLWPMHTKRRDRVKCLAKTRTGMRVVYAYGDRGGGEEERRRRLVDFRVDFENAETARFSGWLDKSGRC